MTLAQDPGHAPPSEGRARLLAPCTPTPSVTQQLALVAAAFDPRALGLARGLDGHRFVGLLRTPPGPSRRSLHSDGSPTTLWRQTAGDGSPGSSCRRRG